MRLLLFAVLLTVLTSTLHAQNVNSPGAESSASTAIDLPVRKVVLYKNGVGYFEHAGTVNGNQRVSVDFTSNQLNDVLQSLTALDSKGGTIGAVGYNSTMPIEQQLKSLALGLNDNPVVLQIYEALRGQQVEVTGTSSALSGRIVTIESRVKKGPNGETAEQNYFLTVETAAGALRTVELTDAVSVRMVDPTLQKQFASYLEIIASARDQQLRHLTLEDRGQGERELQVSYISEVPVWKSTYRIVFPRDPNGNATVQGWAVVDNTVGADWDDVQLSLVAGAPQSFIQPLSEPLYTQRPTIPIATVAQNEPTTQEAAERSDVLSSQDLDTLAVTGRDTTELLKVLPGAVTTAPGTALAPPPPPGAIGALEGRSGKSRSYLANGANTSRGVMGYGYGAGGGVYRASNALHEGDVSTNAFDDFFEYALTQPVTIHKNQSAMVPILQQDLPATHVTLWSDTDPTPLRAIWLENKSNLTLDSGSFSIFENGEFAGEGLLDPIHPGEKRLLSYAVDQAVKVRRGDFSQTRTLHHVTMHEGVLVQTTSTVTDTDYVVTNAADLTRAVVVEHTRQPSAVLDSDTKPDETTATAYRFRMALDPHQSKTLHVREHANVSEDVQIGTASDNVDTLISVGNDSPDLAAKLKPVIDAQTALSDLNDKLDENNDKQKSLTDDESRYRENLKALKDSTTAKRFVDELNQAEDEIQAARKEGTDLEKQRDQAQAHLDLLISQFSFDADVNVVLPKTE